MHKLCDVVMEGGGVKGLGLVGALHALEKNGYDIRRVAGTSAGAIASSLIAAGYKPSELVTIMGDLDYTKFRDPGFIDNFGLPGKAASLLFEKGIYEGHYLQRWLADTLAERGVRTFADLKSTEPWAMSLPPEQRYKLVVVVTDLSRGRMVRLPWDYHIYGLNPDEQTVASAVRASISLPFFYEPVQLNGNYLVDGGVLSNFPISLFDSLPEHPIFGIKLSAKRPITEAVPVGSTYAFAKALIDTMSNAHDLMHLDDPKTTERTIFIDTTGFSTTDFGITKKKQQKLYSLGLAAGEKFMRTWNFEQWKKEYMKS